jgi:hypothetical protein
MMKFVNKEVWDKSVASNGNDMHDYGGAVNWFAEHWADAMEKKIREGYRVKDIAKDCSHEVNNKMGLYGMTGFQYGCAVAILAEVWYYGDDLRIWHNLDTQISNEGERANEKGTVLNPALLTIESKEG